MGAPDPQTVREIAQEVANIALHDAVHVDQWITAVIDGKFGNECKLLRSALHTAVARRMAVVKPSWPAEQPQDAQPERDNPAPGLWWSFTGGADTCYLNHDDNGSYRECCMRAGLAYVLKLYEQQIRASVATEQDGDVRAVAATLAWIRAEIAPERKLLGAIQPGAWIELEDRFMDRIAELDAREAPQR